MNLKKFNNSPIDEVNSHEWMYHGSYDFIKEDEFYNLFYSIWKTRHEEIKEDEESIFSSEYLDYKGYRLRQTNGQGTIAVMTKL